MRGYVIAGGASSRMGTDKARLPHGGVPIAVHLLEVLEAAGLEAVLIRRGQEVEGWVHADGRAVQVIREADTGPRHPLHGVATALDHARADVFVCPCDVPALQAQDVELLCGQGPCVALGDRVHPLVAVIPWSLREMTAQLIVGNGSARALVRDLPRVRIPSGHLFDRNTPADLGVCSVAKGTGVDG